MPKEVVIEHSYWNGIPLSFLLQIQTVAYNCFDYERLYAVDKNDG